MNVGVKVGVREGSKVKVAVAAAVLEGTLVEVFV